MEAGTLILDTRPYYSFAGSHIPGAYSISHHGNLATFAAWILPAEKELILVLEQESDFARVKSTLHNVGLDQVAGYLAGGVESWVNAGLPVENVETISVSHLRDWMAQDAPLVLDTRAKGEWKNEHIPGTILVPGPDVRHLYTRWDVHSPVVVLCNTSNRSMTAASLLKQRGFQRVINAVGGTTAWAAAGYPMASDGEGA